MTDLIKCNACDNSGWRKHGKISPVGWYYVTLRYNDETFYIYACSRVCTSSLAWHCGPGSLI